MYNTKVLFFMAGKFCHIACNSINLRVSSNCMKTLQTFIVILTLSLLSCNNSETKNENKNTSSTNALNVKDSSAKPNLKDIVYKMTQLKDLLLTTIP